MRSDPLVCVAIAVLGVGATSCVDPVHDRAVEALGPERRGVRPGPNHRPGQPCRTCHGADGPGSPEFSIAGTVYLARGLLEPVAGVTVVVTDREGQSRRAVSNEVGNFYIGADTYSPAFPIRVALHDPRAEEGGVKAMESPIPRTGDCATCHWGADDDPTHMPAVFLRSRAP